MTDGSPSRHALRIVDFGDSSDPDAEGLDSRPGEVEDSDSDAVADSSTDSNARSTDEPKDNSAAYSIIERVVTSSRGDDPTGGANELPRVENRWGRLSRLEPVGAGAWSRVYRAWDAQLERTVALKLLRVPDSESVTDTTAVHANALREARNLAKIRHPNVITIYGAERESEVDGIWMEFIDGDNLDEIVARHGPFSPEEACWICATLARALAAVHGVGLIHRDIKSANVMRERGGRVVLMDFGVGADASALAAGRVSPGTGTPLFMAPEILRGETESVASDVYSLGVVLFFLLTGRYPVDAMTVTELRDKHAKGQTVSIRDVRPEVPERVVAVCERLLRPTAGERYQSAGEAAQAIHSSVFEDAREQPNARPGGRNWFWVAALIVVSLVAGVWVQRELIGTNDSARIGEIRGIDSMKRLTSSGTVSSISLSPSGDRVAYLEGDSLFVQRTDGKDRKALGAWAGNLDGWFPDEDAVLLSTRNPDQDRRIVRVDAESGSETVIVEGAWGGDVTRDGRWLVYASLEAPPRRGVWKHDLDTGREERLVEPDKEGEIFLSPRWSVSGERLSYMEFSGWAFALQSCNADGSAPRGVESGPMQLQLGGNWAVDDQSFIASGKLHEVFGVWKLSVDGGSHTLLSTDWESDIAVSVDAATDRIALLRQTDRSRIVLVDTDSGSVSEPFENPQAMKSPSFSADERFLFSQVLVGGFWQIWRGDLESGRLDPYVAIDGQSCVEPAVSDSTSLLYLRGDLRDTRRFGGTAWAQTLWEVSDDRSRNEIREYAGVDLSRLPSRPSTENHILYTEILGYGHEALFVLTPQHEPRKVVEFSGSFGFYGFCWGASADRILLSSSGPGERSFSSVTSLEWATGGRETVFDLAELAASDSTFSPRGSIWSLARSVRGEIAFLASKVGGASALVVFESSTGRFREIHEFEEPVVSENIAWSPSGRWIAIEVADTEADLFVGRLARGGPSL